MKNLTLRHFAFLTLLPLLAPDPARAQLVDDFDTATPGVTATQAGSAPGPTVVGGGPDGNFLRLTDAVNGQVNRYVYDRTDAGAYDTINAQWDYRASTGTTADGFGFVLLPTGTFGVTGDADPGGAAEEPNIGGTFAIGFDLHPAASQNDISFHYDGLEFTNGTFNNGVVDLNDGNFHRFNLEMQRVGNGTNATLTVTRDVFGTPGTPQVVLSQAMPFTPYENRVGMYGRTGGLNVAQDLDNINVTSTTAFAGGLPAAPVSEGVFQDFDSSGATSYVSRIHSITDVTNTRPGPLLMAGDAGSDGAFLRILTDGVNSNKNSVAFDAADQGVTNHTQTVSMDMRMTSGGNPADGVGVLFLPTATYGERGAGPDAGEFEQGNAPAGVLKVGFDLYDGLNDLVVHNGTTEIARVSVPTGTVDFNSGAFNRYHISFEPSATGGNMVVEVETDINGTAGVRTEIANTFVLGGQLPEYRVQVGGRTGGAFHNADIDNVTTSNASVATTATTSQNFEGNFGGGQTGFKAYKMGAGLVPAFVDAGGDNVLRLIHNGEGGQTNTLAFDLSADGMVTASTNTLLADFQFRADGGGAPADGFSARFLPTSIYGTEGFGTNGANAEEPNLAGVLAVGLDFYDTALGVNDISLHYNGSELINVRLDPVTQVDLDDNAFHDISIFAEESGGNLIVDVSIDGTTYITGQVVSGFTFVDSRLEFAGRSGGSNMTVDLDDISFSMIPEPSSTVMLIGGLLFLGRRRRS